MTGRPINFAEKFEKFSKQWLLRIIAQMNDAHFKLARVQGEFVWHSHPDTDEVLVVIDGEMAIHFRDGVAALRAGEMLVVPRGVEHKPVAARECKILLVEAAGTANTGDVRSELTAEDGLWI